jgi:hypothetical protein
LLLPGYGGISSGSQGGQSYAHLVVEINGTAGKSTKTDAPVLSAMETARGLHLVRLPVRQGPNSARAGASSPANGGGAIRSDLRILTAAELTSSPHDRVASHDDVV